MKLSLVSFNRDFSVVGAPVTWGIRVDDAGTVGTRVLAPQIIGLAETDADLNALNTEMGGPGVWDEATLIEAARRALGLDAAQDVTVAKPPVMG